MITAEGLARRFVQGRGRSARVVQAVRAVSFTAADRRITGLLGANGAGKTTSLRMVAGLIVPDAGRVAVDGIDVAADPRRAQARMGVLADARGLYGRLTARENIAYYGRLHGMGEPALRERTDHLARLLDMEPLLERRTEGFSQGERMKTALARALVHDPPNIVLDEPTNGLDVMSTRALREVLRELRDVHGKCIVFSTHIMQEVERLCDEVVVMADGCTTARGTVDELLARSGSDDLESGFVALVGERREVRP